MSVASYATSVIRAPGQSNIRNGRRARFCLPGFTLIELLVVIAVIAILAAMLFPVFAAAKESGRQARCLVQLKQLTEALISYADDNSSRYVPAASDIFDDNLCRWHGTRPDTRHDFDPSKGPLWAYFAKSGGLKQCPSAADLRTSKSFSDPASFPAFESGCGGFGYNGYYVGGTYYRNWPPKAAEVASTTNDIARPSRTVMLADAAMPKRESGTNREYLIEYSIAEPPFAMVPGCLGDALNPSIHFRHNGQANVAWCDGHVTSERMCWTMLDRNVYRADSQANRVGWFGPRDNSLFDER